MASSANPVTIQPGALGAEGSREGVDSIPGPASASRLVSSDSVQAHIDAFFDGVEDVLAFDPAERRAA